MSRGELDAELAHHLGHLRVDPLGWGGAGGGGGVAAIGGALERDNLGLPDGTPLTQGRCWPMAPTLCLVTG